MKSWKPLAETFFFDSFRVEPEDGRITCSYSTDAGHAFQYEYILDGRRHSDFSVLDPAVFALGMAALPSYWKATLAPKIVIKAGRLSPEQVAFWENLFIRGLGEFFYVNEIDFRGILKIESDPGAPDIAPTIRKAPLKTLVPFGGGKDSLVTGELLKSSGRAFSWFELNPRSFAPRLQEVSGNTDSVRIGGDAEKNFGPVKTLVAAGAPNGHVPVTAMYMMGAAVAAEAHGYGDIVFSLERSANQGNVDYLGQNINHQYSKSFEFEKAAHDYIQRYVDSGIRMFSLLRPLYELQIVREFVKYPKYFPYFVSCNKGLATGVWCGVCPKCAFMFMALSAFLPPETVVGVFKKNLFEDASLVPLFEELIGVHEVKPFECVGTFEENSLALYLSGEQYLKAGLALPLALTKLPIADGKKHLGLLDEQGPHLVPSDYRVP